MYTTEQRMRSCNHRDVVQQLVLRCYVVCALVYSIDTCTAAQQGFVFSYFIFFPDDSMGIGTFVFCSTVAIHRTASGRALDSGGTARGSNVPTVRLFPLLILTLCVRLVLFM